MCCLAFLVGGLLEGCFLLFSAPTSLFFSFFLFICFVGFGVFVGFGLFCLLGCVGFLIRRSLESFWEVVLIRLAFRNHDI